ncbi:glycosyltransferase, group 1 family protein [Bacteroides clarus YIT 12056]|nr:glycosyltransferase, group 1 family protein [Bacteroides clarus YIT 12056]
MDDIDMQVVNRYIPQKDFLFFLGNTDPKKNAARVLKAYRLYLEQSSVKRPLLIADLTESRIDSLLQQEGIGNALKQHLYYPGYIRNADLATLYNAAFAFLYPSLRESFGIPLVEAMACGTPVITGNTSSMPEVGGPGILAIDPCRPEEIARAVLRLENEDTLYRRQRKYGLLRARQFSWEKTADELIQVYRSLFK